jgi:hypothetical protein
MMGVMARSADSAPRQLTTGEQRALASFLAGRLPAGQLETELARARGVTQPPAAVALAPPQAHVPALHAA